jgi:hypothetical protein
VCNLKRVDFADPASVLISPGELFDLEELAQTCQDLGRWSFFVTSVPLNMPGGVSSPPNALAIF